MQQQQQQQFEGGPEQQAAEEQDPDMIPGVVTGEDVVAYYGLHGQDSPVKFFYCVR
jgi:dynein heavy chain